MRQFLKSKVESNKTPRHWPLVSTSNPSSPLHKKHETRLGMVPHVDNPSTRVGGLLQERGLRGLFCGTQSCKNSETLNETLYLSLRLSGYCNNVPRGTEMSPGVIEDWKGWGPLPVTGKHISQKGCHTVIITYQTITLLGRQEPRQLMGQWWQGTTPWPELLSYVNSCPLFKPRWTLGKRGQGHWGLSFLFLVWACWTHALSLLFITTCLFNWLDEDKWSSLAC